MTMSRRVFNTNKGTYNLYSNNEKLQLAELVVEKTEKSVVFSLTYKYKETAYTIFSTLSNPPIISHPPLPPIINNYYNVQPPYYSNPSYYSGLESNVVIGSHVIQG